MVKKEWGLENWNGVVWAVSNKTGGSKPYFSSKTGYSKLLNTALLISASTSKGTRPHTQDTSGETSH